MNSRIVCIYSPLGVYCCILNTGGYCVCLSGGLFNCHQKNDSVNILYTTHTPVCCINLYLKRVQAFVTFWTGQQEFISTIDEEQKDQALLELLSNGKGSLQYAKNLVEFGGSVPSYPPTKPSWCTCGVCRPMPSEEENKCCGKVRCITSYVTF